MFMLLCIPGTQGGQKRADSLELELQMVVSCRMGAGTQTQVLWKKEQQVLLTTEPPLQPQRQFSSQSIPSPM